MASSYLALDEVTHSRKPNNGTQETSLTILETASINYLQSEANGSYKVSVKLKFAATRIVFIIYGPLHCRKNRSVAQDETLEPLIPFSWTANVRITNISLQNGGLVDRTRENPLGSSCTIWISWGDFYCKETIWQGKFWRFPDYELDSLRLLSSKDYQKSAH